MELSQLLNDAAALNALPKATGKAQVAAALVEMATNSTPADIAQTAMAQVANRDTLTTTLKITVSLDDFAQLANEQPEILTNAKITVNATEVIIEFSATAKLVALPEASPENAASENETAPAETADANAAAEKNLTAENSPNKNVVPEKSAIENNAPQTSPSENLSPAIAEKLPLTTVAPENLATTPATLPPTAKILAEKLTLAQAVGKRAGIFNLQEMRLALTLTMHNENIPAQITFAQPRDLAKLLPLLENLAATTAENFSSANARVSAPINTPPTLTFIPPSPAEKLPRALLKIDEQIIKLTLPENFALSEKSWTREKSAAEKLSPNNHQHNNDPRFTLKISPQLELYGKLSTPTAALNVAAPNFAASPIDKFIMFAGLTPSTAMREAATALLNENLPIERRALQTLLALVAGRSGDERVNLLAAGARLMRSETPLTLPVAVGNAALHHPLVLPDLTAKISTAQTNLREVWTNLSAPDAPEISPEITAEIKIALEAAIAELEKTAVILDEPQLPEKLRAAFNGLARSALAAAAAALEKATTLILRAQPDLQKLDAALGEILTRLENIPPEKATAEKSPAETEKSANATGEKTATAEKIAEKTAPENRQSGWSKFAHPGIREIPAAWREVIATGTPNLPRLENALREILSATTPEATAKIAREVGRQLDNETLRALAANLQALEREEIAAQPSLTKLATAARELGDLGRLCVAMKAENLATSNHEQTCAAATIPFKFNQESGDGKLQMFYRQNKRGTNKNWSQRVLLDLALSALGNVLGDLRFTAEKKLNVVIAVDAPATFSELTRDNAELAAALTQCGFPCTPEIRLITKPAPSTAPLAPPPANSGLDIKA